MKVAQLLVMLIDMYRYIFSPFLGRNCRFDPSCSAYAIQALQRYGALRGLWLSVRRLSRCHPWNAGGIDQVP